LLSGIDMAQPGYKIFQRFFHPGAKKPNIPQITHLDVQVKSSARTIT